MGFSTEKAKAKCQDTAEKPSSFAVKTTGGQGEFDAMAKLHQVKGVSEELRIWREEFSIEDAKAKCRDLTESRYSIAIMASGGLGDAIAAVRVGFQPIVGTEIHDLQQQMWSDLTAVPSSGDVYELKPKRMRAPSLYGAGMPCQHWSVAGEQAGEAGKGGSLYIDQGELITKWQPEMFYLEQSPNVKADKFRGSFSRLVEDLEELYVIHQKEIRCWEYGDPQNRTRLFIVGVHKKHGDKAKQWKWPTPKYNAERYPIAMDIAVEDTEVPPEYWREEKEDLQWKNNTQQRLQTRVPAGEMDVLASWGPGMGNKSHPNKIQSWWGLLNTQLTSNGGGQRPPLSWRPGEPLKRTRLAVPQETLAAASFSSSYEKWVRSFHDNDDFLRLCVNNAIPMQTGVAVIQQCHDFLEYLGVEKDVVGLVEATNEYRTSQMAQVANPTGDWEDAGKALVKSILLDTGAQMNCVRQAAEKHFKFPKKSQMVAAGVGGKQVGRKDGKLKLMCLNTAKAAGRKPVQQLEMKATSFKDFQDELMSFDPFYQEGLSLAIRQPEEGPSEIYDWQDPSWAIPTRYDWVGGGGWWIDYIYEDEMHKAEDYVQTLAKETEYRTAAASSEAAQMLRVNSFSVESAEAYLNKLLSTKQVRSLKRVRNNQVEPEEPGVTFLVHEEDATDGQLEEIMAGVGLKQTDQVTYKATHPGEVEIKGVKAGLHHGLNKQPYWAFHGNHGHCGVGKHTDGTVCPICVQVKGSATKYYKKYAPYKDVRMGHTWGMDAVTMETRSVEGNKYLVVLRDLASDDFAMVWLAPHQIQPNRLGLDAR